MFLIGAGARALFYPTLLYNFVRNKIQSEFRWWDRVDEFILLGAVPFPTDVQRLKELGVHGVVTLNEPYETLVSTSLYHAHDINHLVILTRDYDSAALKYWGPTTHINFSLENYHQELEDMKNMTRQEYVAHLRRKNSGFSRGASIYRGVTRHHQHGRWQARIGRVAGNKDLYLGTFSKVLQNLESLGNEVSEMKNWVSRNYPASHSSDQHLCQDKVM